ncbi:MAG TPA: uroporphyrinogen-III decarboxylase-like protein [Firmicutes bacterium]|nr:uroporphyrinogen-III decarboxylase-like protein [Bacillota bacterium]
MKREPDFNRLKKVLQLQGEPDVVPFYELFADREVISKVLGRPYQDLKDRIEFQYKLGYDFVTLWARIHLPMQGAAVTEDTAPLSRGKRAFRTASMCTIATWEDFENYPWPQVTPEAFIELDRAAKEMPDGMKGIVLTGHVLEDPMGLMGYEGLSYAMVDNPDLVEAVFDRVGRLYEEIYRYCVQHEAVGAMLISDDLGFRSGTMISPKDLRRLVFPWYKRYCEICHAYDKPVILHSCGNLREIIDDLVDCGIDAKHSYEDIIMPVEEAKQLFGDRMAILGGLDVDFLCRATEEEVRARTREILEACMPGGGYALGTGNSVANYIPTENYLAMLDEGRKIGVY